MDWILLAICDVAISRCSCFAFIVPFAFVMLCAHCIHSSHTLSIAVEPHRTARLVIL